MILSTYGTACTRAYLCCTQLGGWPCALVTPHCIKHLTTESPTNVAQSPALNTDSTGQTSTGKVHVTKYLHLCYCGHQKEISLQKLNMYGILFQIKQI